MQVRTDALLEQVGGVESLVGRQQRLECTVRKNSNARASPRHSDE